MAYCYCVPKRDMLSGYARQIERANYAQLAVGEGVSPTSYYVRGSKGYEVARVGREVALKAWATRRRRMAERKAAAEAARRPGHPVIAGTLPADAQRTRSLVLTATV